MIQNFDDAQTPEVIDADLCIIGSGAAGITVAGELLESGLRVIVLAGGSRTQTPEDQALYDSRIVGLPHQGTHAGRARYAISNAIFGGSAEYVALQLKDWKIESTFFWYVTVMMAIVFLVSLRLPKTASYLHTDH